MNFWSSHQGWEFCFLKRNFTKLISTTNSQIPQDQQRHTEQFERFILLLLNTNNYKPEIPSHR